MARGQKGYNGVMILSRLPVEEVDHRDFCTRGDARHVAARLPSGAIVHNLYIPAGGDLPDPALNPKFAHKLDFLAELRGWFAEETPQGAILVGDLNVAPREDDVWSHRQLLRVVSHTPIEVEAFAAAQGAGGWVDVTRAHHPRGPALLVVVLPRARLAGRRQGPPARPRLGDPRPRRALRRQPHRPPRPRLGQPERPCPGLRRVRGMTDLRALLRRLFDAASAGSKRRSPARSRPGIVHSGSG